MSQVKSYSGFELWHDKGLSEEAEFVKKYDYDTLQKKCEALFDKIKHGDEEHQKWLKSAIDEHFNAELEAELKGAK